LVIPKEDTVKSSETVASPEGNVHSENVETPLSEGKANELPKEVKEGEKENDH